MRCVWPIRASASTMRSSSSTARAIVFKGRIDARSARLENGAWLLTKAWVSDANGTSKFHATYHLPTTLTPVSNSGEFRLAFDHLVLGSAPLHQDGAGRRLLGHALSAVFRLAPGAAGDVRGDGVHGRQLLAQTGASRRAGTCDPLQRDWPASASISSATSPRRWANPVSCPWRWRPQRQPWQQSFWV